MFASLVTDAGQSRSRGSSRRRPGGLVYEERRGDPRTGLARMCYLRRTILWFTCPGTKLLPTRTGPASVCRPRPSGRKAARRSRPREVPAGRRVHPRGQRRCNTWQGLPDARHGVGRTPRGTLPVDSYRPNHPRGARASSAAVLPMPLLVLQPLPGRGLYIQFPGGQPGIPGFGVRRISARRYCLEGSASLTVYRHPGWVLSHTRSRAPGSRPT